MKLSKKILAAALAVLMAISMMPLTAFASDASKTKLAWDFTNGVNIQNDGSEYHPAAYGNAKLRMIHYNNNTYSYQYGGLRTADGFVYLENLADYLEADKDIDIKFTLDFGDHGNDGNYGAFAIGSQNGNSGETTFNDVVYMQNDGTLNYRAGGSTESILTGSKSGIATSTNYAFEVKFDNSAKTLTVYQDGALIGEKTDYANLSVSDFNFLAIGVWQSTYYGNFALKSIEISQPDSTDYAAAAKANYSSISKQSINASTGIAFTGSSAGAVTQNVIYPNAAGAVESNWVTIDNSGDSNTRMSYKLFYPASSFGYFYEGNKAVIKIPVILQVDINGSEIKGYAFNYIASTNNDWTLAGNWCKCNSSSDWTQTASGDVNDLTVISTDTSHDHTNYTEKNGNNATQTTSRNTIYLSNTLVYNGAIDNSSYLTTITSTPSFIFSEDSYGYSDGLWGLGAWHGEYPNMTCELSFNDITVKALNYAPMAGVIDEINTPAFQKTFADVAANEWMYTDDSLAAYYKGVGKVATFSLNNYDLTYGALSFAASDMKSAVDDFNAINLVKKTFKATFKAAGGTTIEERTITAGDALGALPANTATAASDATHHNVYTWDGISAATVVTEDTTYTETATETACTWDDGVHSGDRTTYTCTVCGNTYYDLDVYTVTFKNAAGDTVDTRNIEAGSALGALPANTAIAHIANTDTHYVYTWDGITAETTVTGDITYTETATATACSFADPGTHHDADDSTNGYTEKFCDCGNSQITYDALDFTAYNNALQAYDETVGAADYATKYTEDSRKDYEDAVKDAKLTDAQLNNPALPQSIIDAAAEDIYLAGALLKEPGADNTYNLTITDKVEVNFDIDTEFYQAESGIIEVQYVTTDYVDGEIVLGTDTAYYNAPVEGKTEIKMDVAPAQIAEPYVITIKNEQGAEVKQIITSIVDYCTAIIEGTYSDADKEVAKGLLDYGSASETYFNYRASASTPGYSVDHSDDYADFVAAFDAESFRSKAKCSQVEGTDASGKSVYVTGVSYIAQLDPEFRFYINQDNEVYAAMTDVSIDTEGLTAKMVKTSNGFCVSVKGLKASDFAKTFTITIGTYKLTYNGYAFLYTTLREDGGTTDTNLRDLALGVYRYAAACEAKFA